MTVCSPTPSIIFSIPQHHAMLNPRELASSRLNT
jgi:hypothetical protein